MSSTKTSPRDFSIFSLFTAGLACLVPLASAYTKPVGDEPKGNPIITPGLHDVIPAQSKYGITWEPTTPTDGTVTLVLLKGPSTNAEPQYAIAENIPNTGNYFWHVPQDVEDSEGDTGYGIQLIVDQTGQYQYSTQFGISNPHYVPSHDKPSKPKPGSYPHGGQPHGGYPHGTGYPHATPSGWGPGYGHNGTHAGGYPKPTGGSSWQPHNVTMTQSYTAQSSSSAPMSSASMPSAPSHVAQPSATGGAASIAASFGGLVVAAGVAVFAL